MDQVTIGLLGSLAVAAAWDAARRYFEVRRFNQKVLDDQARIERDHEELQRKVSALSEKIAFNSASIANRTPRTLGAR